MPNKCSIGCKQTDIVNKKCRLDCLETDIFGKPVEKRVAEFEGPVKIILVDNNQASYNKKISLCVIMGYFLMGGILTPLLCYVFRNTLPPLQNAHVLFCALGYFMYIGSAFLGSSRWNGATTMIKVEDRKKNYVWLKTFGFIFVALGTSLATVKDMRNLPLSLNTNYTLHSIAGMAAGGLAILDVFSLPFAIYSNGRAERCTQIFGVPSFIMAIASFILILYNDRQFKKYLIRTTECLYMYTAIIVYFCLIVISSPVVSFLRCN